MTSPIVPYTDYTAFAAGTDIDRTRFDGVIDAIRGYCGWHIAPETSLAAKLDGNGERVLMLPTLKLNSVASVVVDGTALTDDEYEWTAAGMLRRASGRTWPCKWRAIDVTGMHGYSSAPADLKNVVFEATKRALSVPAGQAPEKMGPFEFGASQGVQFFVHETAVLDRYKLPYRP